MQETAVYDRPGDRKEFKRIPSLQGQERRCPYFQEAKNEELGNSKVASLIFILSRNLGQINSTFVRTWIGIQSFTGANMDLSQIMTG